MIVAGGTLGFVAEPPQRVLVRVVGGDDFNRHDPVEGGINASKDGSHATATDEFVQPKLAEHLPFQGLANVGRAWRS